MVAPTDEAFRVTFLGGLHWPPNSEGMAWFIRNSWPRILEEVPRARLTIIGKNPSRKLKILATRFRGIETAGYVSDLAPYLKETAAFVVPLLAGGGMRVKILDAWSWGLPVVTTAIGAEGIRVEHGQNAMLAETPERLTEAVVQVCTDSQLSSRLRAQGRATVEQHYDWRQVYPSWDQIYPCESFTSYRTRPA